MKFSTWVVVCSGPWKYTVFLSLVYPRRHYTYFKFMKYNSLVLTVVFSDFKSKYLSLLAPFSTKSLKLSKNRSEISNFKYSIVKIISHAIYPLHNAKVSF